MHADIWAITPSVSATLLRAAAAVSGAGALTLLTNEVAPNGCGYKIVITTTGDDHLITYTIVGQAVGTLNGAVTTEVMTGPNNTTGTTTAFFARVDSITASGAAAANVSVGTIGSLALPRCRIKGLHYVAGATAGSVKVTRNATTGTMIMQVDTPAVASSAFAVGVPIPEDGILTTRSSQSDFAIVTLAVITAVTLFCG